MSDLYITLGSSWPRLSWDLVGLCISLKIFYQCSFLLRKMLPFALMTCTYSQLQIGISVVWVRILIVVGQGQCFSVSEV